MFNIGINQLNLEMVITAPEAQFNALSNGIHTLPDNLRFIVKNGGFL